MGFYVVIVGFGGFEDLVGAVLQLHLTLERLCSWERSDAVRRGCSSERLRSMKV